MLASFAGAPVPTPADAWSPAELGVFARLRDTFLAAGAEQLRRALCCESWLQFGLSFADPEQAGRFKSSGLLRDAVDMWLTRGTVTRFFFMHKPPGMRLRFCVPHDPHETAERIVELLQRAQDAGLLERHEFGIYDQETHQFGGPEGIEIFHRFSTHDSRAILRFRALEAAGATTVDASVLSLLAMNDLVAAVAGDPWEQWDVWCEMRLTGRLVEPDSPAAAELRAGLEENRELLESLLRRRKQLIADLSPEEKTLFAAYQTGNQEVARAFAEAGRRRALALAPRKIVPFFIIFHWNRLRISLDEQIAFTFFMVELLNPKHPLE